MGTSKKKSTESFVKDIRKNTRRIFTAEQKILIVMEGLRAETSVAALWSTSMNTPMWWVALLDEQRGKKNTDVCHDRRLAMNLTFMKYENRYLDR